MIVIPAIDIEGGRVVRGDGAPRDPLTEATALRDAGAAWLHVVDMDRVFGRGDNTEVLRRLAALEGVSVQLGGGYDAPVAVRTALGWGMDRVVIGMGLLFTGGGIPTDRVALNLDLRDARPWPRTAPAPLDASAPDVVDRAVAAGIRTVICRDLERDGTLTGADLATAATLTGRGADVLVAGGLAGLDELARARDLGLAGAIVGRALHEGRFRLEEALAWSA